MLLAIFKMAVTNPVIGGLVNSWLADAFSWWVSYRQEQNAKAIKDAAQATVEATNEETRRKALQAWRDALSRRAVK